MHKEMAGEARPAAVSPGQRELRHVIVLMFENRSFDHLIGWLDHPDPVAFNGLRVGMFNPLDPSIPDGQRVEVSRWRRLRLRVDPNHEHTAVMSQLGLGGAPGAEPTNDGYVASYEEKASDRAFVSRKPRALRRGGYAAAAMLAVVAVFLAAAFRTAWSSLPGALALLVGILVRRLVPPAEHYPGDGKRIMRCWDPRTMPALSRLATGFTVCSNWFSSVPGETWPNRQFLHAGTSAGTADIHLGLYHDRTIYELLADADRDWRIYYDGPAQVACYPQLWNPENISNWFPMNELFNHIKVGDLATFSFVEPNQGLTGASYSMHPGNNRATNADLRRGDRFAAAVYEALRQNADLFGQTLLIITFDEHGGTFDHVGPPVAVPPDDRNEDGFDFTRLGVRVPTLMISPWIPGGIADTTVYDHSSIPETLRRLFASGQPALKLRAQRANTFERLMSASERRSADLPDLSRIARRPRNLPSIFDRIKDLVAGGEALVDDFRQSLGWLGQVLDEALPPIDARDVSGDAVQATLLARSEPAAATGPDFKPSRRIAARGVGRLAAHAHAARTERVSTAGSNRAAPSR